MVVDGLVPVEPPRYVNEVGERELMGLCGSCEAPKWITHLEVEGVRYRKVVHDMGYHKAVGGAKRAFQKMLLKGGKL